LDPLVGAVAIPLAELGQPRGDAANRVQGAELDALSIRVTEAPAQHIDEYQRCGWPPLQVGAELGRRQRPRLNRLNRGHAARPRLDVTKGELSQQIARAEEAE